MSDKKYSGLKRMMLNDEVVQQGKFIEAVVNKTKLPEELVKVALKRVQLGDEVAYPEDVDKKTLEVLKKVENSAKKSYEEAEKAMKQKKEDEENRIKEELERKEAFIEAYRGAESEALAIPVDNFVDTRVAEALGHDFVVDTETGKIELKKGADPVRAFGVGFRNLNDLFSKAEDIGEGFAIYEARLALAAKEQLGDEWPNALAGADKRDIVRIRKNMRAIEIYTTELGFKLNDTPIGTLRVLTEASYDKEDKDNNNKIKKKVIEDFQKRSKEKGSPLNQIEARALVATATPQKQAEARKHWSYFYITAGKDGVTVYGSYEFNDEAFKNATVTIDSKSRVVTKEGDDFDYKQIEPVPEPKPEPEPVREPKPAAKKAAKKAAKTPEPEPEPEEEEEAEPAEDSSLDELFA